MPYYYSAASPAVGGSAVSLSTTISNLLNIKTTNTGQRACIQKLIVGWYSGGSANAPADTAMVQLLQRSSTLLTSGTAFTASPLIADAPAAASTLTTAPSSGAFSNATPLVQLGYNGRGTAMWAAFNADEAIGIMGSTAPNAEVVLRGYASASSPANFNLLFSE